MRVISPADTETRRGPEEWFTGTVWMDGTSIPQPGAAMLRVLFEPGARTNWHTHPEGQFLYIVTGTGRAQREGEGVQRINTGDTVYIAPNERHWHGAAPDTFMVHVAVSPALESDGATQWQEPVADEDYLS
ncbi:(R)-mandelonitrile lyase [Rubrobacter aplysinae]|uniref:(R)-mandelonitrile lyase n=1 Tax=Rubrobacter aplysinae TaxID=909625 RepID=UPI00064BB244|nr:cupin domain-containing protein [Rubrobacter aplysinae]